MEDLLTSLRYYRSVLGFRGAIAALRGTLTKKPVLFQLSEPKCKSPIYIRVPSSDVKVFTQIFRKNEYLFDVNASPEFIVDAGANIGLASVYFANRFPNARILSIEPESTNFEILAKNVAPYPNIRPIQGALWGENTPINVVDRGLGNWGFMTEAQDSDPRSSTSVDRSIRGMTIDTILEQYGMQQISILKMDIEGSELEVFRNSSSWIDQVDSLIIELHERMQPGCNRVFYNATNGFNLEWSQGEFVYLTRTGGCLKPPGEAGVISPHPHPSRRR